jgi:hypothetical protein
MTAIASAGCTLRRIVLLQWEQSISILAMTASLSRRLARFALQTGQR